MNLCCFKLPVCGNYLSIPRNEQKVLLPLIMRPDLLATLHPLHPQGKGFPISREKCNREGEATSVQCAVPCSRALGRGRMLAVVQLQKGPRSALGWTPPPRRTLGSFWGSDQALQPCWRVRRGGTQVGLSLLIPSLLPSLFLKLFIYLLFLAVLGLRFCARAFSSCDKRGPLFIVACGPLIIAASLVAEHRLQTRRLSSCGSRA